MANLLVFAHFGEAKSFVQGLSLVPHKGISNFFISDQFDLIITGEGHYRALAKTMKTLGAKSYQSVINVGIAGSLKPEKYLIDDLVFVRTSYHFAEEFLHSKSFPLLRPSSGKFKSVDCTTLNERLLNLKRDHPLRAFADIVDRECWGAAYAATEYKIPFLSLKIISDLVLETTSSAGLLSSRKFTLALASTQTNAESSTSIFSGDARLSVINETCNSILKKSNEFSDKLFVGFQKEIQPFLLTFEKQKKFQSDFLNEIEERIKIKNSPHFRWTLSLENQYSQFLNIKFKQNQNTESVFSWVQLSMQKSLDVAKEIQPKERTKFFLQHLEESL